MSGRFPSPWEVYAAVPYHYPLIETFPIVRIPVAGPDPFNTLAVVRGVFAMSEYTVSDGHVGRPTYIYPTPFQLVGHDPRVMPAFQHSTTGSLQMIQTTNDSSFVEAVDGITGTFDKAGTWTIKVTIADAWNDVFAGAQGYYSSWVLCYEPPLDHGRNPGRPWRFNEGSAGDPDRSTEVSLFGVDADRPGFAGLTHPRAILGGDSQARAATSRERQSLQGHGSLPDDNASV